MEDRLPAESAVDVESKALIRLMDYFAEVQTRRRDADGLPLTWVGALATLEETLAGFVKYQHEHVTVKEVGLTVRGRCCWVLCFADDILNTCNHSNRCRTS